MERRLQIYRGFRSGDAEMVIRNIAVEAASDLQRQGHTMPWTDCVGYAATVVDEYRRRIAPDAFPLDSESIAAVVREYDRTSEVQ